jgi:hypothetical protein
MLSPSPTRVLEGRFIRSGAMQRVEHRRVERFERLRFIDLRPPIRRVYTATRAVENQRRYSATDSTGCSVS